MKIWKCRAGETKQPCPWGAYVWKGRENTNYSIEQRKLSWKRRSREEETLRMQGMERIRGLPIVAWIKGTLGYWRRGGVGWDPHWRQWCLRWNKQGREGGWGGRVPLQGRFWADAAGTGGTGNCRSSHHWWNEPQELVYIGDKVKIYRGQFDFEFFCSGWLNDGWVVKPEIEKYRKHVLGIQWVSDLGFGHTGFRGLLEYLGRGQVVLCTFGGFLRKEVGSEDMAVICLKFDHEIHRSRWDQRRGRRNRERQNWMKCHQGQEVGEKPGMRVLPGCVGMACNIAQPEEVV